MPPDAARFLCPMYLVDSAEGKDDRDGQYYLFKKLEFYSVIAARVITAPEGFPTDLASIPRVPLIYDMFGNRYGRAAVIHDYLYSSGRVSREIADLILREAMESLGASKFTSWLWWKAVRAGGAKHYTNDPAPYPA